MERATRTLPNPTTNVPLTKRRRTSKNKATSDSEDDQPLAKKNGRKPPKVTADQIGEDDDSDVPLTKKLAKEKAAIEKKAETTAKAIRAKKTVKAEESEDSDDVPLKKAKAAPKKKANGVKKEDSDDDKPLKKAPAKRATPKSQSATPAASQRRARRPQKTKAQRRRKTLKMVKKSTNGGRTLPRATALRSGPPWNTMVLYSLPSTSHFPRMS